MVFPCNITRAGWVRCAARWGRGLPLTQHQQRHLLQLRVFQERVQLLTRERQPFPLRRHGGRRNFTEGCCLKACNTPQESERARTQCSALRVGANGTSLRSRGKLTKFEWLGQLERVVGCTWRLQIAQRARARKARRGRRTTRCV